MLNRNPACSKEERFLCRGLKLLLVPVLLLLLLCSDDWEHAWKGHQCQPPQTKPITEAPKSIKAIPQPSLGPCAFVSSQIRYVRNLKTRQLGVHFSGQVPLTQKHLKLMTFDLLVEKTSRLLPEKQVNVLRKNAGFRSDDKQLTSSHDKNPIHCTCIWGCSTRWKNTRCFIWRESPLCLRIFNETDAQCVPSETIGPGSRNRKPCQLIPTMLFQCSCNNRFQFLSRAASKWLFQCHLSHKSQGYRDMKNHTVVELLPGTDFWVICCQMHFSFCCEFLHRHLSPQFRLPFFVPW